MGFFTMRAISHANEIEDTNMKTIVSAGIVLILVRWLASRGNKLPGNSDLQICPKYLHDRA